MINIFSVCFLIGIRILEAVSLGVGFAINTKKKGNVPF